MKNKTKGFTLVELIVVMAIMSIIMAGVMQLFKPMRTIFVDTTQYETQRNAQNGIIKYITESVRFATDMGIYDTSNANSTPSVPSAAKAAEYLAEEFCINNKIIDAVTKDPLPPYDSTAVTNIKNEVIKYSEIIIIDNVTKHRYTGRDYTGRLIRRKMPIAPATPSATIAADPSLTSTGSTKDWRIAMGEAYYGTNIFLINLSVTDTTGGGTGGASSDGKSDDGMLNVAVSSTRNGKRDISNMGKETTLTGDAKSDGQITKGGVLCRNLTGAGSKGVSKAGVFDVSKYSGSSSGAGTKTYIVFLTKDGRDKVDAVVKASAATP